MITKMNLVYTRMCISIWAIFVPYGLNLFIFGNKMPNVNICLFQVASSFLTDLLFFTNYKFTIFQISHYSSNRKKEVLSYPNV